MDDLSAVRSDPAAETEPELKPGPGQAVADRAEHAPWSDDHLGDEFALPIPGRHSAGTATFGYPAPSWLPAMLRGRTGLRVAHLVVVLGLVAVCAALTAWLVMAAKAQPVHEGQFSAAQVTSSPLVDLPADGSSEPATVAPSPGATAMIPATGESSDALVVDVAGKVRRPGIAVLPSGSRVVDALRASGGARRGVDLTGLNLARRLVDGEQILVGVAPQPGVAASAAPAATSGVGPLVDLNTAGPAELDALPQIGPVTAGAIIAWRDAHGGFSAVEELLEVDGIGEATLAQVAPFVTV